MALADRGEHGRSFLQPGPAIGIVRSHGQPLQQKRHIAIRNRKGRRIDRGGERPASEPSPQPIPELNAGQAAAPPSGPPGKTARAATV